MSEPYFGTPEHTTTHDAKCTVYVKGEFTGSIVKMECSRAGWGPQRYAQYDAAVVASFVPKGKRKPRAIVETRWPSLLILDGWGHPDPDGMWDPATEKTDPSTGVSTARARYRSFDPQWQADFSTKIDAYIASGAKVLVDFRQHDTKDHHKT